ncbi:unnamed protein product [Rhizophagus irregularis]|nr:unnamed protein product [Rhizophagus irregularis]
MAIIAHWNEWYQIEIAHSIRRYIRIGYDICEGEDIVEAAKHLSGTSLANLEPNRSQLESDDGNIDNISKKESNPKPNIKTIKDTIDLIVPEFMDNNNENNELEDVSSVNIKFQFPMGWALKSNQKLGGKGKGKRMKKQVKELLKSFFLNGNLNQKDKMLAKDMYNELLNFVESGELEAEDVPKITTIQNWISTYARTFKEQATENMVKEIINK